MPYVMIVAYLIFAVYLVTRFGSRIAAKTSGLWWAVLFFLAVVVITPEVLHPLASLLGFQLVSNLIFAILIAFLFKESLQNSTRNTDLERALRNTVAEFAAESYLQKKKPADAPSAKKRVLVFLPTYNEQENILAVTGRLEKMMQAQQDYEIDICFVDDGSKDQTRSLLKSKVPSWFTYHLTNRGVSGGLLTAIKILKNGGFDFLVQCDADGQHPIDLIPHMVTVALKKNTDLLIGSRFSKTTDDLVSSDATGNSLESTTVIRKIGGSLITFFLGLFGKNLMIADPTSGFRIYSQKACHYLENKVPDDYPEPETIALLALRSFKIEEVRVRMQARVAGSSSISGMKSIQFMIKVCTALLSLRIRSFLFPSRL
jgi:hypothetical protein